MNWFNNQRQLWIMEAIHIYGFINREHIIKKFNVSVPQASKDLNNFVKDNANLLDYNKSSKRYELNEAFSQSLHRAGWP